MNKFKTSGSQARRTLISRTDKYGKIHNNAFCKSNQGRKSKSCATNSIIYSILNVGLHKQQVLALNDALKYPNQIDQAIDCGYFWAKSDKIHSVLSIIERQASILKIVSECISRVRK